MPEWILEPLGMGNSAIRAVFPHVSKINLAPQDAPHGLWRHIHLDTPGHV